MKKQRQKKQTNKRKNKLQIIFKYSCIVRDCGFATRKIRITRSTIPEKIMTPTVDLHVHVYHCQEFG